MIPSLKSLPLYTGALLLLSFNLPLHAAGDLYKDPQAPVESRVEDLLGRLSLAEKIELLGGKGFTLHGNERLGIPAFVVSDASMGVRGHGKSTAYANGIGLACTWDVDLAEKVGRALGSDCRARGVHWLLGPGMNLYRAPMCGRNFEYLGEDPILAGNLASAFIQGLQSQQVGVTAKHFAANEQEVDRHHLSSEVDERTLRELYLKPFEIVVKNGALGVMSSYNPINGVHASQNDWLLNHVLKQEWGFKGIVMSDWESCYDTEGMAQGGLDLEMPSGKHFNAEALLPLISSGRVLQPTIDDKVRRQLRVAFTLGWFDRPQEVTSIPLDNPTSDAVALRGAQESVTLLKNENNLLPLDPAKIKKVVLLGHNADPAVYGGAGSAIVDPFHAVSVYQGVLNLLGSNAVVKLVPWKRADLPPEAPTEPGTKPKPRITALDANGAQGTPPIPREYLEDVKTADLVIVCVGFAQSPPQYLEGGPNLFDHEGEGNNRPYTLPPGQPELICKAIELNPKSIVILNAGGSVATDNWIGKTPVLLHAFYPGQEGGTAIAQILFGKITPSGKLAFSWEKRWEDSAAYGNYPTYGPNEGRNNIYKEGVFLGYRWFDSKHIEPLFPFGFGLSTTSFAYSDLKITEGREGNYLAHVVIKNTGARPGAEIVQLYVQPPSTNVPRPVRELKGFSRVELAPGEAKPVSVSFSKESLAYWSPDPKQWTVTPGKYVVAVGTSSAKLNLQANLEIH